jgi:protein-disulfide isomerase
MMKTMTVGAMVIGVAVVGTAVLAADSWTGWLTGNKEPAKPAARPAVLNPAPAAKPAMTQMGNALDIQENDRIVGSMTAPVTMIEYASMTCSHCADFATKVMPKVKAEWVQTGKVKYVLRDLAWDNLAVGMAKVARCAPPRQFLPIADAFFANQERIVMSADPLGQIKQIASGFGMDSARVEECVKDPTLQTQVEASKKIAMETLGVRGTPSIFVNGKLVENAGDYEVLKKALTEAHAKKAK